MSQESDGRYFAWIKRKGAWTVPKIDPQIIRDLAMMTHQLHNPNTQAQPEIVAKHVLGPDEYDLTIAQLIEKYPAPIIELPAS